jgi:DNA transformation protein
MTVTKAYREYVQEHLAPLVPLRVKPMFGEAGVYAEDLMFGMIVNDALYFRVDDTNRADYEALGISPFVAHWNPTRPMPYYEVPRAVIEDPARLQDWATKAIAIAATLPKKAKPASRRARKTSDPA